MSSGSDQPAIRKADLDAAVAAGVIEPDTADRLLTFMVQTNAVPAQADEENLRLITSFNDIFVTIGLALFLGALTYMVTSTGVAMTAVILAVVSWAMAEVFTRIKRLALPSIVLLVVYGVAVFVAITGLLLGNLGWNIDDYVKYGGIDLAVAGFLTAGLIAVHWLRFRVPITIAAGCAALAVMVMALTASAAPGLITNHPVAIFLPLGLAIFALAMWFDMSDRARQTRRIDIAFWLHLLAAPFIVHPVIAATTSLGKLTQADAGVILVLFVVLGLIALISDRRALLVSSLIYLGYATYTLLANTMWASLGRVQAVFVVGAIVLLLSVAWRPLRGMVLQAMPDFVRLRVPPAV